MTFFKRTLLAVAAIACGLTASAQSGAVHGMPKLFSIIEAETAEAHPIS